MIRLRSRRGGRLLGGGLARLGEGRGLGLLALRRLRAAATDALGVGRRCGRRRRGRRPPARSSSARSTWSRSRPSTAKVSGSALAVPPVTVAASAPAESTAAATPARARPGGRGRCVVRGRAPPAAGRRGGARGAGRGEPWAGRNLSEVGQVQGWGAGRRPRGVTESRPYSRRSARRGEIDALSSVLSVTPTAQADRAQTSMPSSRSVTSAAIGLRSDRVRVTWAKSG